MSPWSVPSRNQDAGAVCMSDYVLGTKSRRLLVRGYSYSSLRDEFMTSANRLMRASSRHMQFCSYESIWNIDS
eukprot:6206897-Pleurochrysis_carterae.AAC.2